MKNILVLLLLLLLLPAAAPAQGWVWASGSTGGGVDAWPVATDPSGNVFAAGISFPGYGAVQFGSVTVTPAYFTNQSIIAKYDPDGNPLWARGTTFGDTWLMNIAADRSGNSFMYCAINDVALHIDTLSLTNGNYPATQYALIKFDPSGNVVWARNDGNVQGAYAVVGGISYALGTGDVTTDAAGNIYITGNFRLPKINIGTFTLVNSDPSGMTDDIFVAKYDPSGNVVWAVSFTGKQNDDAYGITVTPSGEIYICGVFGSNTLVFGSTTLLSTAAPGQNAFIARLSPSGVVEWAAASGGAGGEYAIRVASDQSNNVYLTGALKDNSISFAGTAIANPTPGIPSLYLAKFTPENTVSWARTVYENGAADSEANRGVWGYSLAMSPCGNIWVSGAMDGEVVIDGNVLGYPEDRPASEYDLVFAAAFNADGHYVTGVTLPSGGDDQNGIACDAQGNLLMCSDYIANYPFAEAHDTLSMLPSTSAELLYVAKFPPLAGEGAFAHGFQAVCLGAGITLSAAPGFPKYLWSTGDTVTTITAVDTGTFWALGYDSCVSSALDTFFVGFVCGCGPELFVPNSFTPNGDGMNDVFYPRSGRGIKGIRWFRVYNRWGEQVFARENMQPNDITNAWDGTYDGEKPRPDVYVWEADVICDSGPDILKKGNVTIIR